MLCDFHREQAWDRWLKKGKNGMNESGEEKTKREIVLEMMRSIARAETEEDMKTRIEILKSSQIWSEPGSSKFRTWITETWFSCLKVSFL